MWRKEIKEDQKYPKVPFRVFVEFEHPFE